VSVAAVASDAWSGGGHNMRERGQQTADGSCRPQTAGRRRQTADIRP
jgi:hypothetical protein